MNSNYRSYEYCDLLQITSEAYSSCLNHALLTDQEEVMGLLVGNQTKNERDKKTVITIFSTISMTRKCKQKDRVEFDAIKMAQAAETVEQMKINNARVIGWYHSHPKITVPPSHVDLETQEAQQFQGAFVGIIISCFNCDQNDVNKINVIAFQTKKVDYKQVPHYIPIEFINEYDVFGNTWSNACNSAITFSNILRNLLDEEEEEYQKEKLFIEPNDTINYLLLLSSRQSLLCKIIQNVSTPYFNCLNSEIENLRYYLKYVRELNAMLRKNIKN